MSCNEAHIKFHIKLPKMNMYIWWIHCNWLTIGINVITLGCRCTVVQQLRLKSVIESNFFWLYIVSYRYILDGFPTTMKQVELMTERCIIPVRVIELEINSKEVMVRGLRDRMSSARFVLPRIILAFHLY